MGEIFHALEVLNRSMKLGLDAKTLLRAEMGFKSALAMRGNPAMVALAADPAKLAEGYELTATLRKRTTRQSLDQLSKLAVQAVKVPNTRVEATTFKQIDKAFAGLAAGAGATAAGKKAAAKAPVKASAKPAAKASAKPAAKAAAKKSAAKKSRAAK